MKWYVVHTFASHEFKIKELIEKGIAETPLQDKIGQILIPTHKTFIIKDGKKVEKEKKLFNSYIVIEADLDQSVYNFIKRVPGVTNFLGTGKKPVPLDEFEVNRLLGIQDRDKEKNTAFEYFPGDMVKVIEGPFADFEGIIDKVSADSQKLIVNVTVFGRTTPVEVNAEQVEAIK